MLNSMLGPTYPPISCASCLHKTGVPYDSPLEGQSPWDFALITPGKARRGLFYFIFLASHRASKLYMSKLSFKSTQAASMDIQALTDADTPETFAFATFGNTSIRSFAVSIVTSFSAS